MNTTIPSPDDPHDDWRTSPEFITLEFEYPEAAERLSWHIGQCPQLRDDLLAFLPFFLESERIPKLRAFIRAMLGYPATEEGESRIMGLFYSTITSETMPDGSVQSHTGYWTSGSPITEKVFSAGLTGPLFGECCQLLTEIGEFGSGFSRHGNIVFWGQVRNALQDCLESEDPDAAWPIAIAQQYLSIDQIDDEEFLNNYYRTR